VPPSRARPLRALELDTVELHLFEVGALLLNRLLQVLNFLSELPVLLPEPLTVIEKLLDPVIEGTLARDRPLRSEKIIQETGYRLLILRHRGKHHLEVLVDGGESGICNVLDSARLRFIGGVIAAPARRRTVEAQPVKQRVAASVKGDSKLVECRGETILSSLPVGAGIAGLTKLGIESGNEFVGNLSELSPAVGGLILVGKDLFLVGRDSLACLPLSLLGAANPVLDRRDVGVALLDLPVCLVCGSACVCCRCSHLFRLAVKRLLPRLLALDSFLDLSPLIPDQGDPVHPGTLLELKPVELLLDLHQSPFHRIDPIKLRLETLVELVDITFDGPPL
jgi:hypothetical protein